MCGGRDDILDVVGLMKGWKVSQSGIEALHAFVGERLASAGVVAAMFGGGIGREASEIFLIVSASMKRSADASNQWDHWRAQRTLSRERDTAGGDAVLEVSPDALHALRVDLVPLGRPDPALDLLGSERLTELVACGPVLGVAVEVERFELLEALDLVANKIRRRRGKRHATGGRVVDGEQITVGSWADQARARDRRERRKG